MSHPVRRAMMKPAIKGTIALLARQLIVKKLVSNELHIETESVAVRSAIADVMRPLHASQVDLASMVLLHELGFFHRMFTSGTDVSTDEGFLNARAILVDRFPIGLFCESDYVPSNAELQMCRPPTIGVCEARLSTDIKIVDAPGIVHVAANPFHGYATLLSDRTTVVHVVGLHAIKNHTLLESEALVRTYSLACDQGAAAFGLLFSQADKSCLDIMELPGFCTAMLMVLCDLRIQKRIPIRIAVTSGFDPDSSHVALAEMAADSLRLFREDPVDHFLPIGISPHRDVELSRRLQVDVCWSRSVFGGLGTACLVRNIPWSPHQFRLLSTEQQQRVKTVLLAANRPESLLRTLPSTSLYLILSFAVSISY